MTWGVISWPVDLPALTLQWKLSAGSAKSESIAALDDVRTWVPASGGSTTVATGTAPQVLASEIDSEMGADAATVIPALVVPPRLLGWQIDVTTSGAADYVRLVFASLADARAWGFSAATVNATNTAGNVWRFSSVSSIRGAWSGGCERVQQDEPGVTMATRVTGSPYAPGANTHVTLGERTTRAVRWLLVDAAFVHALMAGESMFAGPAGRSTSDPNGLLEQAFRALSSGAVGALSVEGRDPVLVQTLSESPSLSDIAARAGGSGRRYTVTMDFEVVPLPGGSFSVSI